MTAQRPRADEPPLAEHELTALWLTGRVPAEALPWPLLRAGRAGRGPGPDVREATFLRNGVPVVGDVEVHLRASDLARHGHLEDLAYAQVILHLVWQDDRPAPARGTPASLPLGATAPTVAVGPLLGLRPARVRALLARGPSGRPPCHEFARGGVDDLQRAVRREGQRRLAERAWQAGALAVAHGWAEAWSRLLDRALAKSAGRHAEGPAARAGLAEAITTALLVRQTTVARALTALAVDRPRLVEALRADGRLGLARAGEVAWNAALPLLIALATAYADADLAQRTARLAASWPAPRPYGRTEALEAALVAGGDAPRAALRSGGGALWQQGLLHLQDLWCSRGGCGVCPLSAPVSLELTPPTAARALAISAN
ncbi:MAG: DUF2851 family protein [Dehalococcoidia bacterium]|nr:DUF2851 family protein [Dehalococcoidia bacterium]